MTMIRILLVDDRDLMLQGIKLLLEDEPSFQIVGFAKNGRDAVEEAERLQPDIVLIDLEMPKMDGITATEYISCLVPQTKVIVITSHDQEKYVIKAIQAGAKGYLLKSCLTKELKQVICAVNQGYSQIESKLLAKVVNRRTAVKQQTFKSVKVIVTQAKPTKIEQQSAIATTKSPPRRQAGTANSFSNYCFNFVKTKLLKKKRSPTVMDTTSLSPIFETIDEPNISILKKQSFTKSINKPYFKVSPVFLIVRWIKNSWSSRVLLLILSVIISLIIF